MKKAILILTVTGAVLFIACVFTFYTVFRDQNSELNAMYFARKVKAQITDMRISESTVGGAHHSGSKPDSIGTTTYYYHVKFLVTDIDGSSYDMEISVTAAAYKEYEQLEKNKDMDINLYHNEDGLPFLSLKDAEGAQNEYPGITFALGRRLVIGLILFAVSGIMLNIADKLHKKAKQESY